MSQETEVPLHDRRSRWKEMGERKRRAIETQLKKEKQRRKWHLS
jgi:hypothetical protein